MKKTSLAARLNKAKQAAAEDAPHGALDARGRRWTWLSAVLCLTLTAAASYALLHFVILSKLPRQMLGSWVVTEGGALADAILEFRRDGTMVATVKMQDKAGKVVAGKITATVEVEGETMRTTSLNPGTGQPHTDVQKVRKLTDREFVFEDSKGTVIKMERLRQ